MRYVTARDLAKKCQVTEVAIHYRIKTMGFFKADGNIGISEEDAKLLLKVYAKKGHKGAARYARMSDPFHDVIRELNLSV
jgi:Zn-dependent peptidase ImmA (M78 family)